MTLRQKKEPEKLNFENKTEIYYEAVFTHKENGYTQVETKKTLEDLQFSIDVWTKCGKYELTSADKVERVMCKLIA